MNYLYAYVRWDWKTLIRGDSIKFYFYFTLLLTNQSFLKQFNFLCKTDISAAFGMCGKSSMESRSCSCPRMELFWYGAECLTNEYKELNIISFKIKKRVNLKIETSEPSCQKDDIKINSNYRTNSLKLILKTDQRLYTVLEQRKEKHWEKIMLSRLLKLTLHWIPGESTAEEVLFGCRPMEGNLDSRFREIFAGRIWRNPGLWDSE